MQAVIPPDGIEPGVYLGLPDSVYHSDPSLGSTDIRRLLVGPSEFFYEWSGNPDRGPRAESEAMTLGKAFHLLLLEGRQAFDAAFACKPEGDGVLVTADDMRSWLRVHGLSEKGTKEAMAERILSVNPNTVIADKVLAEHEANGRRVLPFETYKRVLLAAQHITANPHLSSAFSGGVGELSVFWVRNGIRLKARLDHVKVIRHDDRRCALVTDLKTSFGPKFAQPLEQWCSEVAGRNRIQACHYLDGLRAAKRHIREGLVHGEANGPLNAIASAETALFSFVVLKAQNSPFAAGRLLTPSNPLIEISAREIEAALDEFRRYYEHFGTGTPWVSLNQPTELSADELPRYLL
jgi:hypothetical protein